MKRSIAIVLVLIMAAAVAGWRSQAATDPLALLPESDVVFTFDVNQFLQTKFYATLSDITQEARKSIAKDAKADAQLQQFDAELAKFGLDIKQIRQVIIGGRVKPGGKQETTYGIVVGNIDLQKLIAATASYADKVSIETDTYQGKTLFIVSLKEGALGAEFESLRRQLPAGFEQGKVAVSLHGADIIMFGSPEGVKEMIDVEAGRRPSIMANAQMSRYLSSIKSGALVRFAGTNLHKLSQSAPAETNQKRPKVLTNDELSTPKTSRGGSGGVSLASGTSNPFDALEGFYGSIDIRTGFHFNTTLITKSEEDATQTATGLTGILDFGKMIFSGPQKDPKQAKTAARVLEVINLVKVSQANQDVNISFAMPQAMVDELSRTITEEINRYKKQQR